MYRKYIKRAIGFTLALIGLVILSPFFLLIAIAIKLDTPGPVLFKQKRVGKHKTHFNILKYRTMKIDTPKDVPTHLLENPEQYISRVGRILRKTSGDELPQILQILTGKMSIVGPRPALWNQYDLIKERDKYGANDITPGLTGWAQINGRDELPIDVKARLDGEYTQNLCFLLDCRCFFWTILRVLRREGVVEGGAGVVEPEGVVEGGTGSLKQDDVIGGGTGALKREGVVKSGKGVLERDGVVEGSTGVLEQSAVMIRKKRGR